MLPFSGGPRGGKKETPNQRWPVVGLSGHVWDTSIPYLSLKKYILQVPGKSTWTHSNTNHHHHHKPGLNKTPALELSETTFYLQTKGLHNHKLHNTLSVH